jgi:hypothetical protein
VFHRLPPTRPCLLLIAKIPISGWPYQFLILVSTFRRQALTKRRNKLRHWSEKRHWNESNDRDRRPVGGGDLTCRTRALRLTTPPILHLLIIDDVYLH